MTAHNGRYCIGCGCVGCICDEVSVDTRLPSEPLEQGVVGDPGDLHLLNQQLDPLAVGFERDQIINRLDRIIAGQRELNLRIGRVLNLIEWQWGIPRVDVSPVDPSVPDIRD